MTRVTCHHCGRPIATRDELAVAGRTLRPFHHGCRSAFADRQPWFRRPGPPVNRWRSLVVFNAALLAGLLVLFVLAPSPSTGWATVLGLGALANGWLLIGRAVSYVSIERHLAPAGAQVEPPAQGRPER